MPVLILAIAKWLASKSAMYALLGALAVALFAFWLFAKSSIEEEGAVQAELAALEERAGQLYSDLERVHNRLQEVGEEIETSRRRLQAANQAIQYLDGLLKQIERWVTLSREERLESERQLAEARAERLEHTRLLNARASEQSRLRLDRLALTEEASMLEEQLAEAQTASSEFAQYLDTSWNRLRPYLVGALLLALFGPLLLKLFAYYVWAPLFSFAGPIRFVKVALPPPRLRERGVSAQVEVGEGERLWVKESFLQASDESLGRRTRFVLDWAIPCTCLAAGLVEMVEFSGKDSSGKVTISPQRRSELEVATIEVPAGGRLIARPSCIAGVVARRGERLTIQRRWRLFHPQAWLTFQFRYFVFCGPCALIVTGVRGVRFESIDSPSSMGRRANQVATLGFTPDLSYGVVRAETFWAYLRGFNPLFDDVFRGQGVFLCQEITQDSVAGPAKFWAGFWNGALKILGI